MTETQEGSSSGSNSGSNWEMPAYGLLLAWFAVRIAYLAFELHPYVPPDEATHVGRVLAYAKVFGVPDNGPGTFELGLLDHRPWLYYWAMARALSLNVFGLQDLVFLRLVNGLLGLATAAVGILWVRDWCTSPWARVLFAALITNTLMFSGLFASVSYDNAANLLAATAVFGLTRFRAHPSASGLFALVAVLLAGCLTKRTLLPFALGVGLLVVVRDWRRVPALLVQVASQRQALGWLVVVLVLAGFSAGLYGGNLVRFGKLTPGFEQVVGEQNAMSNRIYARGRILDRFRDGEISLDEARAQARNIQHPGDRNATLFLLRRAQVPVESLEGPFTYLGVWGRGMLRSSVGYLGHRQALQSGVGLVGYGVVLAVALLLFAWRWRPGDASGVPADAAFLALGYAFVLVAFVHYPAYQSSRYIELALQGRYLFPVVLPVYGLVAWTLAERTPRQLQPWIVTVVSAGYLYGDLPWFVRQIDARWVMPG